MRRLLVLLLVLAGLAGAGVLGLRALAGRDGPSTQATDLLVPHGRLRAVASALQQGGVLPPGQWELLLFAVLARITDHGLPLHAAEFRFPPHASLLEVLAILRHARPLQHELTIPEGLSAAQVAVLVDRAPALTGGFDLPAEGGVLPETYAYERGTTRAVLLGRMHAALLRTLATVWAGRDRSVPLSDPERLLVLASIVERETGLAEERPLVAEVFLNRIRQGMRLQSDPTVSYAAAGGLGPLPRPLTRADLLQPNPYNTYVVPALPPGPISAPGLAALQAVAHPAQGGLLYFVANGSGGHAFAASLPDHLRNVAQFRALEAARPGRMPTLDPLRPPPQVPLTPRG